MSSELANLAMPCLLHASNRISIFSVDVVPHVDFMFSFKRHGSRFSYNVFSGSLPYSLTLSRLRLRPRQQAELLVAFPIAI